MQTTIQFHRFFYKKSSFETTLLRKRNVYSTSVVFKFFSEDLGGIARILSFLSLFHSKFKQLLYFFQKHLNANMVENAKKICFIRIWYWNLDGKSHKIFYYKTYSKNNCGRQNSCGIIELFSVPKKCWKLWFHSKICISVETSM